MNILETLDDAKQALKSWFIDDGGKYQNEFDVVYHVVKYAYINGRMSQSDYKTIIEICPTLAHKWAAKNGMETISYIKRLKQVPCTQMENFINLVLTKGSNQL